VDLLVLDGKQRVDEERTRQVAAAQTVVYGSAANHDPALSPVTLALVAEGGVVGVVDVLTKELVHAGRRYTVSGLAWVLVAPEHRGRGYGQRLIRDARRYLERSAIDLVVFTCDRPLLHFYESAGFTCLPEAVLVGGTATDPFPSDRPGFDKVVMATFVSARARRHASEFVGRRIALHPGEVDTLW
jgi:aminoglycoside 2'-N-acetyltransferase I